MALLQAIDYTVILRSYGLWGLSFIAVGAMIWRWLIPLVNRLIERSQARDDKLIQMISENLIAERTTRALEVAEFVKVVDGTMRELVQQQGKITVALDNMVTETKRRRG